MCVMKRIKSPPESKLAFFNEIDNHDMNTKMMTLNVNNAIIELFEFLSSCVHHMNNATSASMHSMRNAII